MKKTIIGIAVALSLSGAAFAGDYGDAVKQRQMCEKWGEHAGAVFNGRGDSKSVAEDRAMVTQLNEEYKKLSDSDGWVSRKAMIPRSKSTLIAYALDLATSTQDAYMYAWGSCMDLPKETY